MKNIFKLGFKLLVITLIAALSLGYVNQITKDKIAEQRRLANEQARKEVFQNATNFSEIDLKNYDINTEKTIEGFEALKSESIKGYVFKTLPKGYGGNLEVIVGISNDGKITGVRVGNHNETPGLGAKATEKEFYNQYKDMAIVTEIGVSKTSRSDTKIKAISGATITSEAVTRGVNSAIEAYKKIN